MRWFDGDELRSDDPPLRLRPGPGFTYAGSFSFQLAAVARVERHVFVDSDRWSIARMLVVHFEKFLQGVDDLYRYRLSDPRELGGATYGRNANTLSVAAERQAAPAAEMARTATWLERLGYSLPDRHAVARFARIIGDDRRSELLIFYHECTARQDNGLLDRAEAAFSIGG